MAELRDAARETEEVGGKDVGKTKATGGFEETVLIEDDELAA